MIGTVKGFAGRGLVVAATDAAWKKPAAGLGYVVSDGRWGLKPHFYGRHDPTGPGGVNIHELRAIALLLEGNPSPPAVLLTDNAGAVRFLRLWQRGHVDRMPAGYSLRARWGPDGQTPTLVRLAAVMAAHPRMKVKHVAGHQGHPLNEAADALASLALRQLPADDTRRRAVGLAEAFLAAWHDQEQSA